MASLTWWRISADYAVEHDFTNRLETQPKIKIDGARIIALYVEPGDHAGASMASHQMPNEARSQALSTERWVRTDGANLGVPFERKALASHGYQFSRR
jgi:hypothetical protein